ncbi:caspase family protein [Lentiprolixibacter aurantiacus]|uniref:Caspase family protein n=1 Tax=Lentiprolixibacter aurantiacus TaxID=2993939 RepID=A0AAE3MLA9_9FLAO|nr:caspase family protein [Lentiprolixibacter aurantiacus]MCX2719920.1 caspase family protein [Lentiprolixibacter aurantiacus]
MLVHKNQFALIIGVGDDLPYTIDDAIKLRDTLIDPGLVGYPKENVILRTGKEADRAGILGAFDELREKTDQDSSILFYYSGHGGKYTSQHKFYLQPYGMTAENYATTWVKAEELRDKINALDSKNLVMFLDCCHAEGMLQSGLEDFYGLAQKLNDEGGVWVVASCQDNQKSWRLPGDENSLFTECLLEVLSGKHTSPFMDPKITITDVVEYIFEEVPRRAIRVLNPKTEEPIQQQPFAKFQMSENVVLSHFPKNIDTHEAIVADLERKADKIDERSFIKLLQSMEIIGRRDHAIELLEKHERAHNDADLLNALGDLYKGRYLETNYEADGQHALKCHQEALELALADEDGEQVFLNAINLAFLYLMLDLNKKQMRDYAKQAHDAAKDYFYPSPDKFGTMGEACIYLYRLDEAKEHYAKVGGEGGIRARMKIYQDAHKVYTTLYNDNPEDPFLKFLETTLLG